jgi:DNA-binding HxlR family transcriptional regulator
MADVPGHVPELCSRFHRASELIGRRWTGAIIFVLLKSRCRFAALRAAIPDITDRMLSERLQELEQEGIVARTVVPEIPVRVEYELTKKGRALASAIDAIAEWAHKWIPAERSTVNGSSQVASRSGDRRRISSERPQRRSRSRSTV